MTLFKRNILAPLPPGAEIVEQNGQRFARWATEGRRHQARVVQGRAGPRIIVGQSSHWYGKVNDAGLWRRVRLFTDKTASERRLAELQIEADRRAAGCRTPDMAHAGRPITEHVDDYLSALRLGKLDANTLRIAEWTLRRLVERGGWRRLADVTADSMRHILASLEAEGATASYLNKHIQRAKAFIHWCEREGRIVGDPLKTVKRIDETRAQRRRARRAISVNEAIALLETAPADRRAKYAFALLAGLRRGEIRRLRWADLRLNAPRPFIALRSELTKNKHSDVLPLHPYLLACIRELPAGDADAPVVGTVPDMKTMARDLLAAGIARMGQKGRGISIGGGRYIDIADAQGRRCDFHALRHWFCTQLDATGASFTTKRALMRHADGGITEGYSHARIAELYAAIERLPSPLGRTTAPAQATEALRTGTDDAPVATAAGGGMSDSCDSVVHIWPKTCARPCTDMHGDARDGGADGDGATRETARKNRANCTVMHNDAQQCLPSPPTPDIMRKTRPSTQVD